MKENFVSKEEKLIAKLYHIDHYPQMPYLNLLMVKEHDSMPKPFLYQKRKQLQHLKISKGQVVQQSGELNTKVYIVKSGLLRSYLIDDKGKEHIFMFAPEGWVLGDNVPPHLPSELFIDALENSEVIVLGKEKEKNFDRDKILNRLAVLQKRIIMLMSASAIERYEHFIENYPDISKRVPQRMIASYLGITPEALSKVKGERKKRKVSDD